MRTKTTFAVNSLKTIAFLTAALSVSGTMQNSKAVIIRVTSDYQTVALAVAGASSGDTIILSPGTYYEKNIEINKPLTISSEWKLTGDAAKIESTVIDASNSILFTINSNDVEISGLKIINGDHTLDINANVSIQHNHMVGNKDPVSMETSGGGYVGFNLLENNGDDGIDLDISTSGSDILIENNKIVTSDDDGIEIRLFTAANQNIYYEIRDNIITGSNNAGIQLISYDVYTGKVFSIHHNIISNCKTSLGCMGGSNTSEDLSGASKMDESVYFYNNTTFDNQMGATGGNQVVAINNIVSGNTLGGFKRFGANSVIANNLFYNNQGNDLIEINASAETLNNIFEADPLLDGTTRRPALNSPCVDAGLDKYMVNETAVIEISPEKYSGSAPDIGALESDGETATAWVDDVQGGCIIRNYPNPFLHSTKISINLSQPGYVKLEVYDATGRNIQTLEEGFKGEGIHTFDWHARDNNGNKLPQGTYIARIQTRNQSSHTKLLLLH